jgi:hypothetical protein
MTYKKKEHLKFVADMKKAGIKTEFYQGRWFWKGPMARTDECRGPTLQEVLSATKVKCQRDNLGFDWCIYPVVSDSTLGKKEPVGLPEAEGKGVQP